LSMSSQVDLMTFEVVDRDVTGLQVALPSGADRLIITNGPFRVEQPPRPALDAPAPTAPLRAPAGSAIVSVSQSGDPAQLRETLRHGALSFFRIEPAGTLLEEEKLLGTTPLTFTLFPGNYELRGYFRPCEDNCGAVSAPAVQCTARLDVTAGQVVYAERVLQGDSCTIRFNAPPGSGQ
jgi:hypothetical protein